MSQVEKWQRSALLASMACGGRYLDHLVLLLRVEVPFMDGLSDEECSFVSQAEEGWAEFDRKMREAGLR